MRYFAGFSVAFAVAVACGSASAAEEGTSILDEISVTATRAPDGIARGLLGASLTIIDAADMEDRQTRVVSDVLRDVPGVAVSRSGAVGAPTQVRIRGAEGNHTLVLIDGVKASDPYYDEFDFATLIADDVARVEVLRGQQSSLYGSDAIGGVISYSTLTGREAPGFSARAEGGTYDSIDTAVRYGGVAGVMDYALSGGYQTTDGYRVARVGNRADGSSNAVIAGKFDFDLSDDLRVKTMLRANRTKADTPDSGPASVIDGIGEFTNKTFIGSLRAEYDAFEGHLLSAASVQRVDAQRDGNDQYGPSGDKGGRTRYGVESTLRLGDKASMQHQLTLAVDREQTDSRNTQAFSAEQGAKHSVDNTGVVAEYTLAVDESLGLGASLRHDDNSRFANSTTYRVQGSYLFDSGTRLRAASGSGVKNPSLTELFGYDPASFTGNPNLKPEKSRGWEAGVDQEVLAGKVLLGATYFHSKLEDEIFTTYGNLPPYPSTPANRTTLSKQKGIELTAEGHITAAWNIAAAYTHLSAKEDGTEEIRRPPNTGSLNLGWTSSGKVFGANLTVRYNGRMTDSNFYAFPAEVVTMDAFTLVNLGLDWQFTEKVQFYGRIENLLNKNYEEVYTYRAAGRAGYAGVRVKF